MAESENIILNQTDEHSDSELLHLISDGINRDLRRYPCRFNTENE